jgi:hypothetical protein
MLVISILFISWHLFIRFLHAFHWLFIVSLMFCLYFIIIVLFSFISIIGIVFVMIEFCYFGELVLKVNHVLIVMIGDRIIVFYLLIRFLKVIMIFWLVIVI